MAGGRLDRATGHGAQPEPVVADGSLCSTTAESTSLTFGIDSCAAVTAIPTSIGTDYPLEPPSGKRYESCTGAPVYDRGGRTLLVQAVDTNGVKCVQIVRARVFDIRRALLSTQNVTPNNRVVTFGSGWASSSSTKGGPTFDFRLNKGTFDWETKIIPYAQAKPLLDRAEYLMSVRDRSAPSCPGSSDGVFTRLGNWRL